MTQKEKVQFLIKKLEELYPVVPIALNHKDAYTLLIAVVLSAQCTDKRVNEVTPALFKMADNPFDMAKHSIEEIRAIIRPCGLSPSKSKNIKALSQQLVQTHNGKVPNTFEELEALPGVGHKTASVILSQVFHIPAFPVDTHIHRLMHRWGLSSGKSVTQTEQDAKKLFPKDLWAKLHLQIIYYGREYSPARGVNPQKDIITEKLATKRVLKELGFPIGTG